MTLVNDRNRNLDVLCPTGLLGQRQCSERDYKSWRRVAISVRKTLLAGEYADDVDLWRKVTSWLADWVEPLGELGAIEYARVAGKARTEADPDIEKDQLRFPPSLHFWQGNWDPSGVVYNERTETLAHYIREGFQLYKDAASAGAVTEADTHTDLLRAEDRPGANDRAWIKWAVGATLATAATVLLTWVYATLKGAGRE